MMNYLGWRGVAEARDLLQRFSGDGMNDGLFGESNLPQTRESMDRFFELTEETFRIASANLTDEEVLDRIQKWINEDRSSAAVKNLENVYADLAEVLDSMRRIKILAPEGIQLPRSLANSVRVALIRRFFTEQLEFINVAKKYVDIEDFFEPHGADRLPARQPRQARRQERRPVPGPPDPHAGGPPHQDHRRGQEAQDLVRHLGRPDRLHDLQQPRRRPRAEVQGHRRRPPGVPPPRPGLQELDLPARDRQGPVGRPGRLRRGARSSSAARACSRTGWARPSPGSTRACSWPTRATSSSASRPCSTPWPRSTPRSSAPTRSSTGPSAASSTSTRRWRS